MVRFLFIFGSLVLIGFVCFLMVGWRIIARFLEERRARQLAILEQYYRRLRSVVDSLLAQADQIDQEQKYLPQPLSADASKRLGKTCGDLVTLTDALKVIDFQLQSRDVRSSRESLLKCCRIAAHAARELEVVRTASITADS